MIITVPHIATMHRPSSSVSEAAFQIQQCVPMDTFLWDTLFVAVVVLFLVGWILTAMFGRVGFYLALVITTLVIYAITSPYLFMYF